jgi:hypothetical protein
MTDSPYIRNMKHFLLLYLITLAFVNGFAQQAVTAMQTEHLTCPIGIDAATPRLSWQGGDRAVGFSSRASLIQSW